MRTQTYPEICILPLLKTSIQPKQTNEMFLAGSGKDTAKYRKLIVTVCAANPHGEERHEHDRSM
jgi:hypothetical protein